VPYIAVAAPVICFVFETVMKQVLGYQVGYELLLVNAALTGTGLWILSLNNYKPLTLNP
jgi:hypothetical protein